MYNHPDSDPFKIKVKQWLKSQGLTYFWMAEQCGVSENTVRNWMAQASIPLLKKRLIMKIISPLPAVDKNESPRHINIETEINMSFKLTPEIYAKLVQVSLMKGISMEKLLNDGIAGLAQQTRLGTLGYEEESRISDDIALLEQFKKDDEEPENRTDLEK